MVGKQLHAQALGLNRIEEVAARSTVAISSTVGNAENSSGF